MPRFENFEDYRQFIAALPNHDTPEILGLHPNADLTLGTNETNYLLNTILDIQPKQSGAGGKNKTREEVVFDKADELLAMMPKGFNADDVRARIRKRPKAELSYVLGEANPGQVDGFTIPLNVFLFQEITRLQAVIDKVRKSLQNLKQAINGEIIMTPELQSTLNSVFDAKPPRSWFMDAGGSETAWVLPSLGLWFQGLLDRERQLQNWLTNTRPNTYWLTGFFNPQGFLTAMLQETTRRHSEEKWALDDVVLISQVTDVEDARKVKKPPEEGVYITGLFLEGCAWDSKNKVLAESQPKDLFTPLPVLYVSATTSAKAKARQGKFYECPCYTRPRRTGLSFVFRVMLPTNVNPEHWTMRGVALLCSKD
jgi:dynein heavy chain